MAVPAPDTDSTSVVFNFLYGATALFTGLGGFVAGKYWDIVFERHKHRNKYHEKLIEKRIANCELIELTLRPLSVISHSSQDDKYMHNLFPHGYQRESIHYSGVLTKQSTNPEIDNDTKGIAEYESELNYAQAFSSRWVSDELSEAFKDLVNFIGNICEDDTIRLLQIQVFRSQNNSRQREYEMLIQAAKDNFEPIQSRLDIIYNLLQAEYANIVDVDSFLKQKTKKVS